jgi:hypothetical protein
LQGRRPLPFGGLPRLRSTVETYGYPAGGRQISSTRGVVSRIEVQYYTHPQNELHLVVQTDAAINPGNSGGPVVQDGQVVGVAFQAATDLQNVGYFIPTEVVHHFLQDAADGHYRGFPTLGARVQNLENPAARRRAGMAPGQSGVMIDWIYPDSAAARHLQVGDVLLAVNGVEVANDGSVSLPPHPAFPSDGGPTAQGEHLRMDLMALIDRVQVGERITVRVLRQGQVLDLDLELTPWAGMARFGAQHDQRPRYLVYGGLVFMALNLELLQTFGAEWRQKADKLLLHEYYLRPYEDPEQGRHEKVILLRRLDHPVNANLSWFQNLPVETLNGEVVLGLNDLAERLERHQGRHQVFTFTGNRLAVLEREAAEAAGPEILERYGVPADRHL